MNILTKILSGLLVLTCLTATAQTEATGAAESRNVKALVETLNADILELDFLTERIKSAEKIDRDVLVFRQDARSFRY